MLESGDGKLMGSEIPATLHDRVARLDRLGAAKEVIQIGAVIGRTFPTTCCMRFILLPNLISKPGCEADRRRTAYVRGIARTRPIGSSTH